MAGKKETGFGKVEVTSGFNVNLNELYLDLKEDPGARNLLA